ncbi:MAG: hypothetical protein HYT37_01855 [Candidatus Sungbacteria bacterium]|nr:hypothetical protein [Candidatus Sungbacteria bacterium]
MFSLKKTVIIAAVAIVFGGFGGYKIGSIAFEETKAPERMEEKKITEGALNLKASPAEVPLKKPNLVQVPPPAPQTSAGAGEGGKIAMNEQAAGMSVAVANVSLPVSGWVAIHEDAGGKPGKILGARRFEKGTHAGVVELLRKTEDGKAYYAMLHADDGDRLFDAKKDMPMKDVSGAAVMAKFNTDLVPTLQ